MAEDIRISTLSRRISVQGVTILGYVSGGQPVGLDPTAVYPTLSQLGGVTSADLSNTLAGKQDVAARGLANGYAPLDGAGRVPAINLPAVSGGGGAVELSNADPQPLGPVALPGGAAEAARGDHRHARPTPADIGAALATHTHTIAAVSGLQLSLDSKEVASNKGLANGYAPLGSDGKVPSANLPPGISQASLDTKADATTVNAALALKANTSDMTTALAGKASATDTRIINAVQPGNLAVIENFSVAYATVQADANKIKRCTASANIVVTLSALSIGTTIRFLQGGTGKITFSGAVGQTLGSFNNLVTTAGVNANVIVTVIAANTWNISGNLA